MHQHRGYVRLERARVQEFQKVPIPHMVRLLPHPRLPHSDHLHTQLLCH